MADSGIRLTIAYSSLANRVHNIVLPAERADTEILIIVQSPDNTEVVGIPQRSDVRSIVSNTRGVAKSRNASIDNARGTYVTFADDDITFDINGLNAALDHLDTCGCALALCQAVGDDGNLRKQYPRTVTKLSLFNSAKAATYEMILRVSAARDHDVRFDEDFGAGAINYLGDEYIFISDLLRSDLVCHFVPATIAQHPVESSGSRWGSEADLRARSIIFTRIFGTWAPLVRIPFAARHARKLGSVGAIARFVRGSHG